MSLLQSRTAIMRGVSPSMSRCELTFVERDVRAMLGRLGVRAVVLPAEPRLPDSVFVEDVAVVLDELAVTTFPGSPARRPEVPAVADVLARFGPVEFMCGPGTLDGGDVLRMGRTLFVGLTRRTTAEGAAELDAIVSRFGYSVIGVPVAASLHLKTACSPIGRGVLLANRAWFEADRLAAYEILDVDPSEPWAANTLLLDDTVVLAASAPRTRDRLAAAGFTVEALDISEFQKAEGGLSCLSLLMGASNA
jgi:dimethylargininase